jgi:hypothetical protein
VTLNISTISQSIALSRELAAISTKFLGLINIEISTNVVVETASEVVKLDFAGPGVLFPSLKSLKLHSVAVTSVVFTEANTPKLENLSLNNLITPFKINLMGGRSPCRFNLSLPELRMLSIQDTDMSLRGTTGGQFGISLSQCPKLQSLHTYKLRGLGTTNFCALPSMQSMSLHQAEGMEELNILYAPKLRELDVQEARVRRLRLHHMPSFCAADVRSLVVSTGDANAEMSEAVNAEVLAWESRKKGHQEAVALNWIEYDDSFNLESDFIQWSLDQHLDEMFTKHKALARKTMMAALPPVADDETLPKVVLNSKGAGMDKSSRQHFKAHQRVRRQFPEDSKSECDDCDDEEKERGYCGPSFTAAIFQVLQVGGFGMNEFEKALDAIDVNKLEDKLREKGVLKGRAV